MESRFAIRLILEKGLTRWARAFTGGGEINRTLWDSMTKHLILIGSAVGLGMVAGLFAQVAIKFLAVVSLGAGPGPVHDGLIRASERPDVFWIVVGATAFGFAAIFYLVWGVVRLVGRTRRKSQP